MPENGQNVFNVEECCIFRTEFAVSQCGFYLVEIRYEHQNWDAWVKLDVMGESGESITYIPPLPRKYTETNMLIYLFEGRNHISIAPRFDQPVRFRALALLQPAPRLHPRVIPSGDWIYLDSPRVRRLTVVSYTGAPLKITAGEQEIPFELEDKAIYVHADPVETREPHTYYHLLLQADALSVLEEGVHGLNIHLPGNQSVCYQLNVERTRRNAEFQIVNLDVNHGNCVLLRLPNRKNLLIDTGMENCARDVIFPYLEEHGIGIDYLLISHYHADHMGCMDAVLERYPLEKPEKGEVERYIAASDHEKREDYLSRFAFLDNTMLCRYDRLDRIWDLGGVEIRVLNSRNERNGKESLYGSMDENENSVSMIVRYKGFRYYHGSDNYASAQRRNLEDYSAAGRLDELACHYMQANHHFHGDMLPEMIHTINPVAVVIPAHQAIYSRSAFVVDYLQRVVETDYPNKRLRDTFVSYLSGTVAAVVNSAEDWHYETC